MGAENRGKESQSNLDFLFKFFFEHTCKMTDENNLSHLRTLGMCSLQGEILCNGCGAGRL